METGSLSRLGLYLQDMHVREMVKYSQIAEAHGFDSVWIAESRLARDAVVPVTAIATDTSRIKVGAGVINTWTRNAALIAPRCTKALTRMRVSRGTE